MAENENTNLESAEYENPNELEALKESVKTEIVEKISNDLVSNEEFRKEIVNMSWLFLWEWFSLNTFLSVLGIKEEVNKVKEAISDITDVVDDDNQAQEDPILDITKVFVESYISWSFTTKIWYFLLKNKLSSKMEEDSNLNNSFDNMKKARWIIWDIWDRELERIKSELEELKSGIIWSEDNTENTTEEIV